ncbi:MAG: ABC transporter permease, partial [Pseudonocardiales bacterium]|nr:ABC transporter permease [Pseudonocardiales bacterium]
VWSGWVGLGRLTGFGKVNLLPGIGDGWVIDTAITLPIGVEAYAAFALWVWLSGRGSDRAKRFARWSAIGSLVVGAAGQIAYHLLTADHLTKAPWPITMAVACLPVAVLGMGAALAHLVRADHCA